MMATNQVMANEAPVFMLLNTSPSSAARDLPISFYESIDEMVASSTGEMVQRTVFVQTEYVLASEEAERIGVDHVAKVKGASSGSASEVTAAMAPQHSALDMCATTAA